MKIEYQIKGVTLDVHDMIEVSNYGRILRGVVR